MKLAILLLFHLLSFGTATANQEFPASLDQYSDPRTVIKLAVHDARKSMKDGKIYFIAVRGYTLSLPGLEPKDQAYTRRYPTRLIEGTADYPTKKYNRDQQIKIRQYAEAFNSAMLRYLKTRSKRAF